MKRSIFMFRLFAVISFFVPIVLFTACTDHETRSKHKSTTVADTLPTKKTDTAKIIYLTFDDGPLNGTEGILAALDKENIHATMFMVGRHMQVNATMKDKFEMAYNDDLLEVA